MNSTEGDQRRQRRTEKEKRCEKDAGKERKDCNNSCYENKITSETEEQKGLEKKKSSKRKKKREGERRRAKEQEPSSYLT